ncbi:MAG: response regulator transcription factor [Veillonellales bacterium]
MKILLVEDEFKLLEALAHLLKKNGYAVDTAQDGENGLDMASTGIYDMLILDYMLPGRNGIDLLTEFRRLGFDTPVLFLTAKDAPQDRVAGLDAGADDYLVKPFFSDELLARVRALTRRKNKLLVDNTLSVAGLTLNPLRSEVIKDKQAIHLTLKESLLLELLMRNSEQVITKEQIMEKVWGYSTETALTNVDLYIFYLRKKLNIPNIKTIRGVGYFFQKKADVL